MEGCTYGKFNCADSAVPQYGREKCNRFHINYRCHGYFVYGDVDGFCIVSSDGDFTRLASRLKESGMDVIGMGENKTPRSFRAACSVFTDLELLLEAAEEEEETPVRKQKRFLKISSVRRSLKMPSLKLSLKMTTRADRQDWARSAAVCRRNIRILMSETTDTVRCLHLSRKLIISTYRKSTIP